MQAYTQIYLPWCARHAALVGCRRRRSVFRLPTSKVPRFARLQLKVAYRIQQRGLAHTVILVCKWLSCGSTAVTLNADVTPPCVNFGAPALLSLIAVACAYLHTYLCGYHAGCRQPRSKQAGAVIPHTMGSETMSSIQHGGELAVTVLSCTRIIVSISLRQIVLNAKAARQRRAGAGHPPAALQHWPPRCSSSQGC